MNEKILAKQLEHDIDRLLDGHALPDHAELGHEYQQALETARLLARHDVSHESRIRKSLKRQLLNRIHDRREEWSPQEKGKNIMKPHTKLFIRMGMIAAVFAALIALPPVRAFAQDLLKQVGPLIIVSQTEVPWSPPPAGFNPTPVPGGSVIDTPQPGQGSGQDTPSNGPTPAPADPNVRSITPEEAFAQRGFKVLMPAYIPNGYTLGVAPNFVHIQAERIASSMVYTTTDNAYLSIAQSTFNEQEKLPFSVGDARVSELTIREQKAIFIEDALLMTVQDANGQNIDLPVDYLMWEENGQFFIIDATRLSQQEMIRIAESLK
jgi:hypothetical protein